MHLISHIRSWFVLRFACCKVNFFLREKRKVMLVNRTAACGRDAREQEGPTTKTERTNGGPGTVVAMGCNGWTSDGARTHARNCAQPI